MEKIQNFWEKCDLTFAHINPNKWLKSRDHLVNSFSVNFDTFSPANKTVVDYGIGAGHLAIYLIENFSLKKYIGIDIAQRSLDAAIRNLSEYNNVDKDFLLVPVDFSTLDADMFCSFAVIQHFPDNQYLDSFLLNLNNSKIPELILQIRYSPTTVFSNNYNTQEGVRLSCRTNSGYIKNILKNYKLIKETGVSFNTNYQTLYFDKI